MMTQHYQVITKTLVSGAIALAAYVGGAAPASAEPDGRGIRDHTFLCLPS